MKKWLVLICLSNIIFQGFAQTYKIKDDGADSVKLKCWYGTITGYYTGQYIKKLNGEKGFYPHGEGQFIAKGSWFSYEYKGVFFEGKISGRGIMKYDNVTYVGDVIDGSENGQGEKTYGRCWEGTDIKFISGTFKNGQVINEANISFCNGEHYVGTIESSDRQEKRQEGLGYLLNGEGKFDFKDKSSYSGGWFRNKRQGQGAMHYRNGDSLIGLWNNDLFNGNGKLTDSLGRIYVGEFVDGQYSGNGVLTNPDGSKMEGIWNSGKFTGNGTLIYKSGSKYIGDMVQGLPSGKGILYYEDGQVSDGQWANGELVEGKKTFSDGEVQEGKFSQTRLVAGTVSRTNGTHLEGTWDEQGVFHGKGIRVAGNGSTWDCEWDGNIPKGKGKVIFLNKDLYEGGVTGASNGEITNWYRHGQGKLTYSNGDVYVGSFSWDAIEGQGKMTLANGSIQEGNFVNGKFIEPFKCKSVKIGNQIWMAENLNVDHFRNGDPIPEAKSVEEWLEDKPAFCYYNNNEANGAKIGKLYNAAAVHDPRGLAPYGWRIPTADDYIILSNSAQPKIVELERKISEAKQQGIDSYDLRSKKNNMLESHDKNSGIATLTLRSRTGFFERPGSDAYGFNGLSQGYRYSDGSFSAYDKYNTHAPFWVTDRVIYYRTDYYSFDILGYQRAFGYDINRLNNENGGQCGLPVRLIKE